MNVLNTELVSLFDAPKFLTVIRRNVILNLKKVRY